MKSKMSQELIDLHLKAMMYDLHTDDPKCEFHLYANIIVERPQPGQPASVKAYDHTRCGWIGVTDMAQLVSGQSGILQAALQRKNELDERYADVIALTAEDIKRLKGGQS